MCAIIKYAKTNLKRIIYGQNSNFISKQRGKEWKQMYNIICNSPVGREHNMMYLNE